MNSGERHDYFLDRLVANLSKIEENKKEVKWILKDGLWLQENSCNRLSLCDLIIIYYNNEGSAIELKRNIRKKSKAKLQCQQGKKFITNEGYEFKHAKLVIYNSNNYDWLYLNLK